LKTIYSAANLALLGVLSGVVGMVGWAGVVSPDVTRRGRAGRYPLYMRTEPVCQSIIISHITP